jgi:hypothetical protein
MQRWMDNIKIDLRETGHEDVNWTELITIWSNGGIL